MEVVEVYRGPDDEGFLLLKGWLEGQGIECLASSDLVHSVHPVSVDGLGEVRLFVLESEEARARGLIEDFRTRGTDGS